MLGRRQKEMRLQKKSQCHEPLTRGKRLQPRPKETPGSENNPAADILLANRGSEAQSQLAPRDDSIQLRPSGTGSASILTEPDVWATDQAQIYATKPGLFRLPILKSTMFFPSIDYGLPSYPFDYSSQFSSGPLDLHDIYRDSTSDSALFEQTDVFDVPERDEISESAFDFQGAVDASTSIVSHDLSIQTDIYTEPARMASKPTKSASLLPCRTAGLHDPTSWDATMPPATRNISLEDVIAAGMQVLLFNRPSPSNSQKHIGSIAASTALPSPYLNFLDTARTRTLAACIQNARSMGLVISDVMKPFCIAPSLFYRPHSASDDPAALLASASNPTIPVNLRPTLAQVLYQHPAFLDLIPIPGFRSRVILSAARKGWSKVGVEGLDLFELKRDMFQDGLSWRSYDSCNEKELERQPWDMKSWEASRWFVKKWRDLMDEDIYISP